MNKINLVNIILIWTLGITFCFGQISTTPTEIIAPSPSVANLMSFVDVPVNTHTGIPDISIPLITLPTHNKEIKIDVSLSYHPANISLTSVASDVGFGWNLTSDAFISRSILNTPDEFLIPELLRNDPNYDLTKINYDDIYTYNFMGKSGKFKINYNGYDNSFSLEKLQKDNLKIEFNMLEGTQVINYFVIYDDKGFKYIFDINDRNKKYLRDLVILPSFKSPNFNDSMILEQNYLMKDYFFFSAHHLSKVFDNNNVEIVNYSYEQFIENNMVPQIPINNVITNKLSQIHAIDIGKILFDFDKVLPLTQHDNDPIELKKIILKDKFDNIIKKIEFEYDVLNITIGNIDSKTKRLLYKIHIFNNDNSESYNFELKYIKNVSNTNPFFCNNFYGLDQFGYLTSALNIDQTVNISEIDIDYLSDFNSDTNRYSRSSKDLVKFGVIEEIKYPTGKIEKYEFESNTFKFNDNQSFLFYGIPIEDLYKTKNFDNHNYVELYNLFLNTGRTNILPINLTGTGIKKLYFKFSSSSSSILSDPEINDSFATIRLTGNGVDFYIDQYSLSCLGDYIELQPGNYNVQIFSDALAFGNLIITERVITNQPLKKWLYGGGLRIKKISHYNSLNDELPANEINYEYQMFDDYFTSSGELYDGYFRNFSSGLGTLPLVGYRNVRVFNTTNNGAIKYTYESFADSPTYPLFYSYPSSYPSSRYHKNYLAYKSGLLKKVEYFNNNNILLKKVENNYELLEIGDEIHISTMLYSGYLFSTRVVWPKLISSTTINFFHNTDSSSPRTIETTESFTYNNTNNLILESVITNSQDENLLKKYFYHTGNSIHSQNRISEIERIETYRASELLSKSQIIYNNNWTNNVSFLPQTIQTAKGSGGYENRLQYLNYDEYGNPLELKQESGIHICYIWGYNKTQPVAKLENIAYSAIPSSRIQAIENATNEASLITALDALRNDTALSNAMITTYTYKPLIGISSVTDPKGDKQTYHYDGFGRLQYVKDAQGNILSENQYHYKTQN